MKISIYNKLFELPDDGFYLYNSYTNNLIKLDVELYEIIKKREQLLNIDDESIKMLRDESILVDDDDELYRKIKFYRLMQRFEKDYLSLTIAPTLNCNFGCKYCYENSQFEKECINEDAYVDSIVSFVEKSKTRALRVTWYGGEPLLRYNLIKNITNKVMNLGINYNAIMITNGYLLNEELAKEMDLLKISQVQITIDGLEKNHNFRRPHKVNDDSFSRIVSNIKYLLDINKNIKISLRVNVDKKNKDEYHKLYFYLVDMFNHNRNVFIHPGFVSNINSCYNNSECLNYFEINKFKIEQYNKYDVPFEFYPKTDFGECVARHINSFVVDANLNIYKCWNDIGIISKSIGKIDNVELSNSLNIRYIIDNDPLESKECKLCSYFPICNGGCPYDRIYKTKEEKYFCKYKDSFFDDFVKTHIKILKEK